MKVHIQKQKNQKKKQKYIYSPWRASSQPSSPCSWASPQPTSLNNLFLNAHFVFTLKWKKEKKKPQKREKNRKKKTCTFFALASAFSACFFAFSAFFAAICPSSTAFPLPPAAEAEPPLYNRWNENDWELFRRDVALDWMRVQMMGIFHEREKVEGKNRLWKKNSQWKWRGQTLLDIFGVVGFDVKNRSRSKLKNGN